MVMDIIEFGMAQKALKELAVIKRERDLVEKSIVSDAAKAKLYAQLDARIVAISAQLEAADIKAQTGAVQAPQGAQARPK